MSDDKDPPASGYASPPCLAHELAPGADAAQIVDPETARDVARWRKAERARLIATRLARSADDRTLLAQKVAATLDRIVHPEPGMVIGLYWPFKGELDLRGWMADAHAAGARVVLPVVVEKAQPLIFREWTPRCEMTRGVWNIPIPAGGAEVAPTVVISPLVGFDRGCYRLGYGGGFYDRTLAALAPRPLVIGVGMDDAAIPTIFPQAYDIPMDVIVTGSKAVFRRDAA